MIELLKKTFFTGMGLVAVSKDKLEEFVKNLEKDAKITEEEGRKFVDEILKESDKARKDLEASIKEQVRKTLEGMNIPTREEFKALSDRIDQLKGKNLDQEKE